MSDLKTFALILCVCLLGGVLVVSIQENPTPVVNGVAEPKIVVLRLGKVYRDNSGDKLAYSGWDGTSYVLTMVDITGYGSNAYPIYIFHGAKFNFNDRVFIVTKLDERVITLEES